MQKKIIYTTAGSILLLFSTGLSHAEDSIDQSDAKLIFTGNTVEGKIIKRDTGYKMYFHPSGKMVRLANTGESEKGIWRINNNELCLNIDSEACYTIKKHSDSRFDIYDQNGGLAFTINKVTLGNPDKLTPFKE